MGVSITIPESEIRTHLLEEFARCSQSNTEPPVANLKQLLEGARSFKIDLNHLPLIYLINENKDGLISLNDVFNFACFQLQIEGQDSLKGLKAIATLQLQKNQKDFIQWFGRLVSCIEGTEIVDGAVMIHASAIQSIYDFLHIGITRVSIIEFTETLVRAGEQIGLPTREGLIPLLVVQNFAQHIVKGIQDLYKEIVGEIDIPDLVRQFKWDDLKEEYKKAWKKNLEEMGKEESD